MTAVNVRKSTSARGNGIFLTQKGESGKKKQRKIPLNNNVTETG